METCSNNTRYRMLSPTLHVITTDEIIGRPQFVQTAELIIATMGARGAFHLRTRCLSGRDYFGLAAHLAAKASEFGGMLVVNDRVDIALTSHAYGVQLGRTSLSVSDVRGLVRNLRNNPKHHPKPDLQIGASIHSIPELHQNPDADWYIFGHTFETASHKGAPPQGLQLLKDICSATSRPIIAIGGITPQNGGSAIEAGASGLAVISGIWDAQEPKEAVINYLSLYDNRS